MEKIEYIELIIRELIRVNESIVTSYDSYLLCKDYENTLNKLKRLYRDKKELTQNLIESMNEFFEIPQNFLSKRIRLLSFQLVPNVIGFEFQFFIPKSVDRQSRQYFCYINMMDRPVREYDSISKIKGQYFILDITSTLPLEKLLKELSIIMQGSENMSGNDELLEELSALEHDQWMDWSKSVSETIEKLIELIDVENLSKEDAEFVEMQKSRLKRWESYWVDYNQLEDDIKEQDREYARKALEKINKK